MRFHELAKKHGFNQQDLLTAVQKEGFDVKNTLVAVNEDVEDWVADQAAAGWIPPPPEKKAVRKKKVVAVKSSPLGKIVPFGTAAAEKAEKPVSPAGEAEPVDAESPVAETVSTPEERTASEPGPEIESTPTQPEPGSPETVKLKAWKSEPKSGLKPKPKVEREPPPPPKPVKRVNTVVKGSAAVGQATPEMLAAIRRSARSGGAPAPRQDGGARPARGDRPAPPRPGPRSRFNAAAALAVDTVVPETDLSSGKPRVKQRIKTRGRGAAKIEEDSQEKKAKAAKKTKGKRDEDWTADDDFGDEVYEDAVSNEQGDPSASGSMEPINTELLAAGGGEAPVAFKHKRADFKSKRIQHELPASFAEMDNDFTRSITGGGRRRSKRPVRRNTMRRSRTRRIAGPQRRDPGQAAKVYLGMTLRDLSVALGVKLQDILGFLLRQGMMIQVNDILSEEDIVLIAENYRIPLDWESDEDLEQELAEEARQQADVAEEGEVVERPPVVTFMGHVDHGKTSLLDRIRHTRVVDGEHGGITQHIGAYSVDHDGKRVTFLDTPGHEAFSAMRARGANLTDIAVLVVAADDGVMPQTEEAASHAKNAGVPIVVAVNKCDLASANPDRVRQELANRLGLLPEEWGGQVGMIEVSAHTGKGIGDLLERILLESEVLELRANPERPATGFVVEARMSEGQGVLSTMLVSDGTLRIGDVMLCSNGYGKVRFMLDEFGKPIDEAGPGTPVRLSGLSAVPEAGDKFYILQDILKARAIAEQRERESRSAALAKRQHVTLENLTSHLAGSSKRELSVIVKADVVGSLEVLDKTLRDLATSEVGINIIHSAVGGINHADVILADASDALILGFHVGIEHQAKSAAISLGVQIRTYHIIYRMIEDMRAALEGLLPPEEKEVVQGHVDIRQVFRASKIGAIAGCYVTDGFVQRTSRIRLYRDQVVIYDGVVQSLKRLKDDAREVKAGFECGIKIANYDAIEAGDVLEAYAIEEIARKL
ncbi:MAG: translation initiation factor IF-2 [Planctomycetota bacterium]|jgi:translation initiation factor IF-2|nr:translation initiation factor IF-2 [Planctomycetota bacterium]